MIAKKLATLIFVSGFLLGCNTEVATLPAPEELTELAIGNYCGMVLTEHEGPKAQLFEKGNNTPLWFTAVRDALAYTRLPGEGQSVVAIYVHDMGKAKSWERPETDGIWILAADAYYVINSEKRGGMGMTEVVPFGDREKAIQFMSEFGGTVVSYLDVPTKNLFPDFDEQNVDVSVRYTQEAVQ
ncbi:MAG: nitrous oxide reductase accessory protein NosL [Sneathiella sp.]